MGFQLVPKSVTLMNDFERCNDCRVPMQAISVVAELLVEMLNAKLDEQNRQQCK